MECMRINILSTAHFLGMSFVEEQDIASDPVDVCPLGMDRIMFELDVLTDLAKKLLRVFLHSDLAQQLTQEGFCFITLKDRWVFQEFSAKGPIWAYYTERFQIINRLCRIPSKGACKHNMEVAGNTGKRGCCTTVLCRVT